jgi:hypothetical protein
MIFIKNLQHHQESYVQTFHAYNLFIRTQYFFLCSVRTIYLVNGYFFVL